MSIQTRVISAALAAAVLGGTGPVRAEPSEVQFAADVERRAPDGQTQNEKLYVGDGRMRVEKSYQGTETVLISDRKGGKDYLLLPAEKSYMERGAPPGAAPAPAAPAPSAESDPCAGVPGLSCKRIGKEELNGRETVKWEMTMSDQGKTLTGTLWLDVQRAGMPIKQVLPNGQSAEQTLIGSEAVEGRKTEKWQTTQSVPNQPPVISVQWYDPELKRAVREEFPGGYVVQLKNVRVGSQPDDLFKVPAGYSKKTPPPPPPPGAQPPGVPPAGAMPPPGR